MNTYRVVITNYGVQFVFCVAASSAWEAEKMALRARPGAVDVYLIA